MSKHLLEALGAMMHPAFTQLVDPNNGVAGAALDIRLMDLDEQGNLSPCADTRYVRLSDSAGRDQILPICLKQGEGYVRLEDVEAAQFTLVQCDVLGNQIMDQEAYNITYQVNGVVQEMDYAKGYGNQANQVMIINMPAIPVQLQIVKTLQNEFHEPMEFEPKMAFHVHVQGCGSCECIELNMENGFTCCLEGLRAGIYEIWEDKEELWSTRYALDQEDFQETTSYQLLPGAHTFTILNTKRPASVLSIDQYVRDGANELIKPPKEACFHIRVIADFYDQIFELNDANGFALELCDLPAGLYDIMVLDQHGATISYLVNAGVESPYAHVEVLDGHCASVMIIETLPTACQDSPLRICKYVRRSDNSLVKPDPNESFKVMLQGCGVCEIFNLNAGNNFCVDMEHICCGEYEVKELDHAGYVASYIVNEQAESTRAILWIHEGGQNCVTIINEERNKGEVTICKVIRQKDGTLSKPDKSARFLVTLRSFFARESFVLDANNDFCVHIYQLKEGSYEVKERNVDGYETSYIIDGGKEERKARLLVKNGCNSDVKIINSVKKEVSGDLRICKYIANAYGDYVKPSVDEEFQIHVEGPCLDECYLLRSTNNWCIVLEGLKKGVYRICEEGCSRYETQYFVNGCAMEEAALVCMEHYNQEVSIVNTRKSNGNLKLAVMVKDCCEQLRKPNGTEFFDVIIETKEESRELRLDERNNFGVLLEDLPSGMVRVTQKDSYGYRVLYDVNGTVQSNACVNMEGENQRIVILNQMMGCAGIVRIHKRVETIHGRIVKPCEEDCYECTLQSRCHTQTFALNAANDFCVLFDDLEEDTYELIETAVPGMKTKYLVNGTQQDRATFCLQREDVDITVLNQVLPLPTLCVHKRIRKGTTLIKPNKQDVYHFQLIAKDLHETYCLDQSNDWCVCLEGFCNQHYEIREVEPTTHVMYQINDCLQEHGKFLFDEEDVDVTIINEACSDAVVKIKKVMRNLDGTLCPPCQEACFEATIENEYFKQCVCLKETNNFCVQVAGLSCGPYTIKELASTHYEIWINGNRQCDGCFTLENEDVDITLINPVGCENALIIGASMFVKELEELPEADRKYHIQVEHEGIVDQFVLDQSNEWCIELSNIQIGDYRITAKEPVLYACEGQCFEHCIELTMGCEPVYVTLLDEQVPTHTITICKRMIDAKGTLQVPPKGSCYAIILQGMREEYFELYEGNDYRICLHDYPRRTYLIEEPNCPQARFLINGTWQEAGCFSLEHSDVEVIIANPQGNEPLPSLGGKLIVHAMVKNCDGDLESAPQDAHFDVMIDGDDVREDITLRHRNGFQMVYDALPKGPYLIQQQPNPIYTRVTYRIHGVEQPTGEIELGNEDIQVDLINYQNCEQGSIRVMKYLRDADCGCFKRPCMEEAYTITLRGDNLEQSVILNASNRWSYVFDALSDGTYEIIEEDGEGVSYIVNGGKESTSAVVEVAGKDVNVKIINPKEGVKHGSIELCKYLKDENGILHDPQANASYWVSVQGEGINQRILLHSANHFYAEVRHLLPGTYEVVEEDGNDVRYTINGGREVERAFVQVNQNHNSVNIINQIQVNGSITLAKYLQADDGTLTSPKQGTYRIHISAPGYNNVISLNEQNHFTTVLSNLRPGLYVIDELDHEGVSYIIDGGSQVDRGVVQVDGTHDVSIINSMASEAKGSLQLTKFLRRGNGQLVRPSGNQKYQFHVSKPGYKEIITLHQGNNWRMMLEHLSDGNYVISELDQQGKVSYIINDGSETEFGIVAIKGNANTVSIINGETASNGTLQITKYLRNANGELVRPTKEFSTSVRISRPGYNEIITLNQANQWSVTLVDLLDGDYVLNEVDRDDDVTWRINGGYEVRYAIVSVAHNDNQVDMIDAQKEKGNSLHIQKFIRNDAGQLVKPQDQERFTLLLSGTVTKRLELNRENHWMVHLDDLLDGSYHLQEIETSYDVSYILDDGEETTNANFTLQQGQINISVINAMHGSHNLLEVTKLIKTSSGALIPPASGDRFQIQVDGPSFHQSYLLDEDNQFRTHIANVTNGTYSIQEVNQEDYVTTYRINGGQEISSAMVNVSEGKNNVVEVINERKGDQNIVDVYKYMMDEQGNFHKPASSQIFRFLLTGNNVHQFYTLNSTNEWHIHLDSLSSGEYEVIEQGSDSYQVQYLINGSDFSSTGEFVASAGNETIVEMVNQEIIRNGKLTLEKKIRNQDGDLIIPGNGESFTIRVFHEASNYDEMFTLDELNGYLLQVDGLASGSYTVEEIDNNGYGVTYIVNEEAESNAALVNLQNGQMANVLIINTQTSMFFHVAKEDGLHVVIE